jgi:hypothetical protein
MGINIQIGSNKKSGGFWWYLDFIAYQDMI